MVVLVHEWNFSTTDSSFFRSSVSTDEAPRDSEVPQSGLSRTGHTGVAVCFILVDPQQLSHSAHICKVSLPLDAHQSYHVEHQSDILVCVFGTPFSFTSSSHGKSLTGEYGCKYGFANSSFGESLFLWPFYTCKFNLQIILSTMALFRSSGTVLHWRESCNIFSPKA